jgi:hypothetical protein
MRRYFGEFENVDQINSCYYDSGKPDLKDREVLYAWLDNGGYDGSMYVLYRRKGKLYENSSGHCSCNGFDWSPNEVTVKELRHRVTKGTFYDYRGQKEDMNALITKLEKNAATKTANV